MAASVNAPPAKGWKLVFKHGNTIKMESKGKKYRITHGVEVFDEMTDEEATRKIGEVIMWGIRN